MKILKTFLAVLMVGLLVFNLVGCGSSTTTDVPKSTTTEKSPVKTGEWSNAKIVTEEFPPLNYMDNTDKTVKGKSTDVVRKAIANLGADIPINLLSWTMAYQMASTQEDVFIYSIARTPQRENLFKWIAPVAYQDVVVLVPSNKDISIKSFDDLKNYKVATVTNDFTEQGVLSKGLSKDKLVSSTNQKICIQQLLNGRADVWVTSIDDEGLAQILKDLGEPKDKLKKVFTIDELRSTLYIAASSKTSDEKVQKFKDAMPTLGK